MLDFFQWKTYLGGKTFCHGEDYDKPVQTDPLYKHEYVMSMPNTRFLGSHIVLPTTTGLPSWAYAFLCAPDMLSDETNKQKNMAAPPLPQGFSHV